MFFFTLFLCFSLFQSDINVKAKESKYYYKTKYITTKKYLGRYRITHYCACSRCCGKTDGITASGTKAKAGRTIGVDPKVIPYGSKVKIGKKIYTAEDTGGAIKGKKHIDIFCKTHSEALRKGVKYKKVYLIQKKKVRIKCKKK